MWNKCNGSFHYYLLVKKCFKPNRTYYHTYLWRAVSAGRAVLSFSPAVMSWLMAGRPRWPSWNISVVMITTSVERQGYNATVNLGPDWMTHLLEWTRTGNYHTIFDLDMDILLSSGVPCSRPGFPAEHHIILDNWRTILLKLCHEFMCLCIGWWLFAAKPWYRLSLTFGYDNIVNFVIGCHTNN